MKKLMGMCMDVGWIFLIKFLSKAEIYDWARKNRNCFIQKQVDLLSEAPDAKT